MSAENESSVTVVCRNAKCLPFRSTVAALPTSVQETAQPRPIPPYQNNQLHAEVILANDSKMVSGNFALLDGSPYMLLLYGVFVITTRTMHQ